MCGKEAVLDDDVPPGETTNSTIIRLHVDGKPATVNIATMVCASGDDDDDDRDEGSRTLVMRSRTVGVAGSALRRRIATAPAHVGATAHAAVSGARQERSARRLTPEIAARRPDAIWDGLFVLISTVVRVTGIPSVNAW